MTMAGPLGRGKPVDGVRTSVRGAVVAGLLLVAACGPGEDSVFTLGEGDCFDDPEVTEDIREVPRVPCDQPHDNEVFATFELEQGNYPGGADVEQQALEGCTDRFPEEVVGRYGDTELVIGVLTPTVDGWEAGDREVVCVLSSPDGLLTGSLLDAQD